MSPASTSRLRATHALQIRSVASDRYLSTIGQNQIQETALEGKETMEGLRDDFSKGEGGAKTGKASYDVLSEGYKIGTMGAEAYAAEKYGKVSTAAGKVGAALKPSFKPPASGNSSCAS